MAPLATGRAGRRLAGTSGVTGACFFTREGGALVNSVTRGSVVPAEGCLCSEGAGKGKRLWHPKEMLSRMPRTKDGSVGAQVALSGRCRPGMTAAWNCGSQTLLWVLAVSASERPPPRPPLSWSAEHAAPLVHAELNSLPSPLTRLTNTGGRLAFPATPQEARGPAAQRLLRRSSGRSRVPALQWAACSPPRPPPHPGVLLGLL